MRFNFTTVAAATITFATTATSHLIMRTPVPYGVSSLNNSPLNNAKPGTSESDYPCKQRPGVYDLTKMNSIAVDTPTEMSFIGSASHGGGTCQIAITKDMEPTANSTFKIIQVFEGGCPIDSDGNGATHPFSFTIPKDFPNGKMVLTWLWYNRIGNREAYMNCAPITVTGGSDNGDTYFDSLPNMYLINLPTSECESTSDGWSSNSVIIPNPGQFIMKEAASQSIAKASGPSCAASAAAQTEGVSGYKASPIITTNGAAYSAPGGAAAPAPSGGASGAPSGGASGAPSGGASAMPSGGASGAPSGGYSGAPSAGASASGGMSAAPSGGASAAPSGGASGSAPAPSGSGAAGSSGMVSISVAPSGGAASSAAGGSAPSSAAAAPSSAAGGSAAPSGGASAAPSGGASAAPSYPAPSGAAPSGVASPSGGASSGGSCSGGGMSCSTDGKKFGLCANGEIVWQPVAPGTSCKNGQIVKRSVIRHPHVRRHVLRSGQHGA